MDIIKCKECGEPTVMRVAENNGVEFYSCCNEECSEYAELLVHTNNALQSIHIMLNGFKDVIQEITDEKNNVR